MKSPIDQMKEEFCTRYNLEPDQITFTIDLKDIEKDLANQIAVEYSNRPSLAFHGKYMSIAQDKGLWVNAHYKKEEIK